MKEEKRKGQAAQGKEKEKANAPVSSLSSLPLPNLLEHIDETDRSVLFFCFFCIAFLSVYDLSVKLTPFFFVCSIA